MHVVRCARYVGADGTGGRAGSSGRAVVRCVSAVACRVVSAGGFNNNGNEFMVTGDCRQGKRETCPSTHTARPRALCDNSVSDSAATHRRRVDSRLTTPAHRRGYLDALCWLTLGATANDYLGAPLTHFAEPITPVSFCGAALRGRWSHAAKPFGTSTSK